jgi:biotin carboxyl carrier protein
MAQKNVFISSDGYDFELNADEISNIKLIHIKQEAITILSTNEILNGSVSPLKNKNNSYEVEVDGEYFHVKIKSELDVLLENMGLNTPKVNKMQVLKAPMPGLVLEIHVQENQAVSPDQKILVLEAMKMENVLKIPHEATIKRILVKKGEAVEKGQTLLELE